MSMCACYSPRKPVARCPALIVQVSVTVLREPKYINLSCCAILSAQGANVEKQNQSCAHLFFNMHPISEEMCNVFTIIFQAPSIPDKQQNGTRGCRKRIL